MKDERIEGYWKNEQHPTLPTPQPDTWDLTVSISHFLDNLSKVEGKAHQDSYRGVSTCRICEVPNGCREFSYKGWRWPIGLRHYIEAHGVKPSADFITFINGSV